MKPEWRASCTACGKVTAMWDGPERRSSASAAARALVTAREQAASMEAQLRELRSKRFTGRRRARELEGDLREIRVMERRCLEALGADIESRHTKARAS